MVRRIWPVMAGLLAFGLILGSVAPVAAYNAASRFHIQLTRLDPVVCNQPIRIRAKLTDNDGAPVFSTPITFEFKKSKPGDTLSPATAVTDSNGRAITTVVLACANGRRIIGATGPNKAKDQITLRLRRHDNDEDDDDDNDGHHHDDHDDHHEGNTSGGFVASVASGGGGSASIVTAPRVAVETSPVSSTTGTSAALLLVIAPVMFGLVILRAYRRRQPRTLRARGPS